MRKNINTINMAIPLILLGLLTLVQLGCSKDRKDVIENSWRVESIKVHADSALQFPVQGNTYTLTFNKNTYTAKLDVNTCSEKVNFGANNKIEFDAPGCTYACCDSEFSQKFIGLLPQVNKYSALETSLNLTGENGVSINLKKN